MKVSTHSPYLLPHQLARLCPFPETHLLLFFLEMHSLVTAAGTMTTMGTSNGNRMEAKLDASVQGTEIRVWDKKRWGGDTPFQPSAATLEGLHSLHIPGSWLSLQEAATPRAFKTLMLPSYSQGTHNSHRPFRRMFTQLVPQGPGYQLVSASPRVALVSLPSVTWELVKKFRHLGAPPRPTKSISLGLSPRDNLAPA